MCKCALGSNCVSTDGRVEVLAPAQGLQGRMGGQSCAQEQGQQLEIKLVSSRMSGPLGQGHSMQVCTLGGR